MIISPRTVKGVVYKNTNQLIDTPRVRKYKDYCWDMVMSIE